MTCVEMRPPGEHSGGVRIPRRLCAVAAGAALLLAGCATAQDPVGASSTDASPDAALLTTGAPATVLDSGDGAELCLGGVAESLPPQCGGSSLVGWDWGTWDGHFDSASGTRWGEFVVVGTYDAEADAFTPTDVVPASEYAAPEDPADPTRDFATACAEPEDGWQVLDASRTTEQTMQDLVEAAQALPGYSGLWVDQSLNPAADEPLDDVEERMNDPLFTIVNVAVVDGADDAEAELREVWGGMLCVTDGARAESDLEELRASLHDSVPGIQMSSFDAVRGVVEVSVTYDDGSLQRRLDADHGTGVVEVTSLLTPAS